MNPPPNRSNSIGHDGVSTVYLPYGLIPDVCTRVCVHVHVCGSVICLLKNSIMNYESVNSNCLVLLISRLIRMVICPAFFDSMLRTYLHM